MTDSYFALEIGEGFIKLVDAKKNGDTLEIGSLGYIEGDKTFYTTNTIQHIENQAGLINKLVNSNKISKKNVALIIPDFLTYAQILPMPRLNEKELISAIKYQADQFIPMPIEETNIDIEILEENESEKKITVLMVAAPKKLIKKIQNTIEMIGLIPESIENELSSTGRFLSEFKNLFQPKSTDQILIINLGSSSTSLYFFDPNLHLIKEIHNFKIGSDLFLKEIQINTNYDLSHSQEILRSYDPRQKVSYDIASIITPVLKEFILEIKRFINLVKEKYQSQINYIYLTNQLFQFPAIGYFIEKLSSIPTKELNPLSICKSNPLIISHKDKLPLFVSTIGANLR